MVDAHLVIKDFYGSTLYRTLLLRNRDHFIDIESEFRGLEISEDSERLHVIRNHYKGPDRFPLPALKEPRVLNTSKEYRIEAIRAYLWHEELARLSTADALALPAGTLWNTPFGADRVPSSRATLVVVEVSGPSDAGAPRRWLDFSAIARLRDGRRRILLRQSIPIVKLIDQGSWHVPFLLHDAGCVPVELHAEILGQERKLRADRLLDSRCGE